jgi:hypothetical protein
LETNLLYTIETLISNGRKSAVVSFLTGSLILLIYYFSNFNSIIYFALFFTVIALIINGYLFIKQTNELLKNSILKNKIIQTLLMMLFNIPIGYCYFEIGFQIYSSVTPN